MIRLELIIVTASFSLPIWRPLEASSKLHSCIFETKENSNLRICIQYLGHHSKTTCQKSAKSMRYRVRPKFEFYRKSLLTYFLFTIFYDDKQRSNNFGANVLETRSNRLHRKQCRVNVVQSGVKITHGQG